MAVNQFAKRNARRSARREIRVLLILVVVFVIVGAQVTSHANAGQGNLVVKRRYGPAGFLSASGTSIVDGAGNAVLLRGANFFGYEYGLWNTHTEGDYQRMASWGFNVVRLPIAWNFIEPQPTNYDEGYFSNYVDRDIAWAQKYGLYIILDMHSYGWSPYFTYIDPWGTAGLPSWAVSGYPNTDEGQEQAKADFWNNLAANGTLPSATNPSMQDRFTQVWKYVAGRYAGQTIIAGYDLLNEPTCFSSKGKHLCDIGTFRSETLPGFYAKVADAIRAVDQNHMLLYEPDWGDQPIDAVRRPNMVYAPHYPSSSKTSLYSYDGDKSLLTQAVKAISQFAAAANQPVFIGEWGICEEALNATQYVRDTGEVMHTYGFSSAWWTYGRSSFGMNLLDSTGAERTTLTENLLWTLSL